MKTLYLVLIILLLFCSHHLRGAGTSTANANNLLLALNNHSGFGLNNHSGFIEDMDQIRRDIDFILYLIGREDYAESIFLLEKLRPVGQNLVDSVHYLTGWVYYRQKKLDVSAASLLQVSETSPVYHKAYFFGTYNLAHTGNAGDARGVLQALHVEPGSMLYAMRNLQMAGLNLLKRDFRGFETSSAGFSGSYHVMARQETRMHQHYSELSERRDASPWAAGILSAAVPGLGRVYAGKTAEGIVSFLYTAALGFTAYDFYRGAGARSPLFIISATLAAVFYAGNILGSATAARRINNEFYHEIDQRILFDMHIPLRNAFN